MTNKSIFLIPSTYGLIGWVIAALFVVVDPVGMTPLSLNGYFIIFYTLLVYSFMTFLFNRSFSQSMYSDDIPIGKIDLNIFFLTSFIGIAGLYIYLGDIIFFYGGFRNVLYIISDDALKIRSNAEEFSSFSFQLSYFSWISVFIGTLIVKYRQHRRIVLFIVFSIILLELFLNLFFIDRTRPVWIIFTSVLGIMFSGDLIRKKIFRWVGYATAVPAAIFILFSYLVSKFNEDFGIFGTMSAYIVSGIGYIDDLSHDITLSPSYFPVRTFLPLSKIMESIGLISDVPNNVLANRYIPFATNVGTLHEPYMSDGGMIYLIILFPIVALFINYLAYIGYRSRQSVGLFLWANCIFSSMISFFVPKFNSVPFYIFVMTFVLCGLLYRKQRYRDTALRLGYR